MQFDCIRGLKFSFLEAMKSKARKCFKQVFVIFWEKKRKFVDKLFKVSWKEKKNKIKVIFIRIYSSVSFNTKIHSKFKQLNHKILKCFYLNLRLRFSIPTSSHKSFPKPSQKVNFHCETHLISLKKRFKPLDYAKICILNINLITFSRFV